MKGFRAILKSRACKITVFCLAVLLVFGTVFWLRRDRTHAYTAKTYPDRQSVKALLAGNRADFDRVADILVRSKIIPRLQEKDMDKNAIWGPAIPDWDEYLTQDEYDTICAFLYRYEPYEISSLNGNPHFVFLTPDASVSFIFYAGEPGDSLERFLLYIRQSGEVTDWQNGWYYRISPI